MKYDKDRAENLVDGDIQLGGFSLTQQELIEHEQTLLESLQEQSKWWYPTDTLNKQSIVYICERSAYTHGYINPLFPKADTVFIPYSDINLHKTEENIDNDTMLVTPNEYVIKNWVDETDTLHLTLFKENTSDGSEIKTIKQNIQFLVPRDKLVSKVLDAENQYLSENI